MSFVVRDTKTVHTNIEKITIIILLLVASVLYLPRLDTAITYDEAFTVLNYTSSLSSALIDYTVPNNHFVNSILIWGLTGLAGNSEFVIRLPAFFAGLLTIALVYKVGERIVSKATGLIAALCLMNMIGFIQYSTQARGYVFSMLFVLLLIYLLLFKNNNMYTLLTVSMALVMTLPTMILLIMAGLIWAWFYHKHTILPMIIGVTAGTMFYVPIGFFAYPQFGRFGTETIPLLFRNFGNYIFPHSLLIAIATVLALTGLIHLKKHALLLILLCFMIPLMLLPVQLELTGTLLYGRNYLYLLPLIALLASINIAKFFGEYTPIGVILSLCVIVPMLWYQEQPAKIFELLEQVDRHVEENDVVVLGCCLDAPLYYYRSNLNLNVVERVIFIETESLNIEDFRKNYSHRFTCEPDRSWGEFSVYLCLPSTEQP